jgi:hypothetical protein
MRSQYAAQRPPHHRKVAGSRNLEPTIRFAHHLAERVRRVHEQFREHPLTVT